MPAPFDGSQSSYKMMLDFYGMRLVDPATGQIGRSETPGPVDASWKRRYQGLLQNSHNYLRITRSKSFSFSRAADFSFSARASLCRPRAR